MSLMQVASRWSDEHHQIMGVQRRTMWDVDSSKALKQRPLIRFTYQGMQDIHD
jgi:hypothetical protein